MAGVDEGVVREKISLRCCVTLHRMTQPCRGPTCEHASAFCINALSCIRKEGGWISCPICDSHFAEKEIVIDVPLTVLLSEEPNATHAYVTQGTDGNWRYRVSGSGKRVSLQDSTGSSARKRPKTSVRQECESGSITATTRAFSCRSQHTSSQTACTLVHRNISSVSKERYPSQAISASRCRRPPTTSDHGSLPRRMSSEQRRVRRAERKASEERQRFLSLAKNELIRRALHEELAPGSDPNSWSIG
eukprot:scaffold160923_cov28-Tisochrysis_lutea.AAC.1